MAIDPGLERVQRWMQSCILQQGAVEDAILSDRAQAEIPANVARSLVLPSKTLSALERLDIYRRMFLPRMEEALAIDYPALKHFLGAEGFMQLVARYVEAYPSRSYTLNRLGDHFPEFVSNLGDLPKHEFCAELARLEYALTIVFDANETPVLTPDAVRAAPQAAWETARLRPIDALRLLAFDYPVSRYLGAVDEENAFPRIARRKNWVVAYRRNYQVHRMELEEPAYDLLSGLASGKTIGDAVASVINRKWRRPVQDSQLFEWFRDWMSEGLFQAMELAS
jgi:hypothetical protein